MEMIEKLCIFIRFISQVKLLHFQFLLPILRYLNG